MIVPSRVTAIWNFEQALSRTIWQSYQLTFHFLTPIICHSTSDFHSVTDERVSTSMLHSSFDATVELDHINSQSGTLGDASEFVIDRLDLDGIERNEGSLTSALVP